MERVKYSGRVPDYLEFPEKGCKRSCKGALHLLPGKIYELTEDEHVYIKKNYPHVKLMKLKPIPKEAKEKPKKVKKSSEETKESGTKKVKVTKKKTAKRVE